MQFKRIALVGVGLLGGSLGLALKKLKTAATVVGYVRRSEALEECRARGVADVVTLDLLEAVRGADLVVLCTPLAQMPALVRSFLPVLEPGCLVTDVGSVKSPLIEEVAPMIESRGAIFLGSHPMAGAEKTGVAAARADLFHEAICVITPTSKHTPEQIGILADFWRGVGGRPMVLEAGYHDQLVSRSSHLPHVVAAELVNQVLFPNHPKEQSALCANGFRDTTRIASGSPEMWRDITLANRKNLIDSLNQFILGLQQFQKWVEAGDGKSVEEFFQSARKSRDTWTGRGRSPE